MERLGMNASAGKPVNCEGYHCLLRRVFFGAIVAVLAFAVIKEIRTTTPMASLEPGYAADSESLSRR